MEIFAFIIVSLILLYLFWFFWGGFVQYFSSPKHTPATTSKVYWLMLLVLLMDIYDFRYAIVLPGVTGIVALVFVAAILALRIRKAPIPQLLQIAVSSSFFAWVISHVIGILGIFIGVGVGIFISLVAAPWGKVAAEMWDEPWWAPQAYNKRHS